MVLLSILRTMPAASTRKAAFGASSKLLKTWKEVLKKFARTVKDQQDLMSSLEGFVMEEEWKAFKLYQPICKTLYDIDVVSEEVRFLSFRVSCGQSIATLFSQ